MITIPRPVSDRRAALGLAAAAYALDGGADLLALLEAAGLTPAPHTKALRMPHRSRKGHALRPIREVSRPQLRPANPCPVGACRNAAPAPGVPCARCMTALDGYLRPCREDAPGEAA